MNIDCVQLAEEAEFQMVTVFLVKRMNVIYK